MSETQYVPEREPEPSTQRLVDGPYVTLDGLAAVLRQHERGMTGRPSRAAEEVIEPQTIED